MIVCEVLKINTNEVWAFDYQVIEGSEMWQRLQESNNPTELGCWFVRNMPVYTEQPPLTENGENGI